MSSTTYILFVHAYISDRNPCTIPFETLCIYIYMTRLVRNLIEMSSTHYTVFKVQAIKREGEKLHIHILFWPFQKVVSKGESSYIFSFSNWQQHLQYLFHLFFSFKRSPSFSSLYKKASEPTFVCGWLTLNIFLYFLVLEFYWMGFWQCIFLRANILSCVTTIRKAVKLSLSLFTTKSRQQHKLIPIFSLLFWYLQEMSNWKKKKSI